MRSLSLHRRRKVAGPLVLFVALVGVGALYTVVGGEAQASGVTQASPDQIAQGRQLFLEGCSSCHGVNAQGGSDGPTLVGVGAAAVSFQVGTGRMPLAAPGAEAKRGDPQYTEEEIAALAAYVATLGPGPAIPSAEDLDLSNADIAQGGVVFRTNCASCHGASAGGGALTHGKSAPALHRTSDQHIWEAMVTGPGAMPVFANTTLDPDTKRDIIAYINSLQDLPNPGGNSLGAVGPVPEGLVLWVVGLGALVGVALWIGAKVS